MIRSPALEAVHVLTPNAWIPKWWRTGRQGSRPSVISSISSRCATAYPLMEPSSRSLVEVLFDALRYLHPGMPALLPDRHTGRRELWIGEGADGNRNKPRRVGEPPEHRPAALGAE